LTIPPPAAPPSQFRRSIRPFGLIIGFYFIAFLLIAIFGATGEAALGEASLDEGGILMQWVTLAATLTATYVMLRRVEKLPWATIGLDASAAKAPVLLKGAAYGAVAIGVASMGLVAVQQLRIVATPDGSWWGTAARAAAVLLPAAFFEELFIRGYAFSVLRRMAGWKLALIVTSVVFGLLHAANPGANPQSILSVTVAGFFLGALFLATGSLYAAGAAHFAWNWVMAALLHTPVSGLGMATPDYQTVDAGPDWLTGGQWGPESGLASVSIMFLVLFYLHWRHLRRMESTA